MGKNAIRVEVDRIFPLANYRYTIRNIASTETVVFIELLDTHRRDGKEITMHSSIVLEIDPAGKIRGERDYFDAEELEARLA